MGCDKALLEYKGEAFSSRALNVLKTYFAEVLIAGDREKSIDMLITDVVMPEMNGRELAGRLQSMHPGLKVLFMSGYTADVIAHHGVLEEGIDFKKENTGWVSAVKNECFVGV